MAFATVDELAAAMQIEIKAEKRESAELALNRATGLIKAYARHPIVEVADEEEVHDGPGTGLIFLRHYPVSSITSVVVNDGTADTELTANTDFEWDRAGILKNLSSGWGTRHQSITIKYTHGFEAVPEDVKHVCLDVARRLFDNPRGHDSRTEDSTTVVFPAGQVGLTDDEQRIIGRYR